MTDRTLDLAKALREAQLQRLEASLSARCATPVIKTSQPINEKDVASQDWFGIGQKSLFEDEGDWCTRQKQTLERVMCSMHPCNKLPTKATINQVEFLDRSWKDSWINRIKLNQIWIE